MIMTRTVEGETGAGEDKIRVMGGKPEADVFSFPSPGVGFGNRVVIGEGSPGCSTGKGRRSRGPGARMG